jgi:hypothetical protein
MPIASDSHSSFMARRLEDLPAVDSLAREDAISFDFDAEPPSGDFVLQTAEELAAGLPFTQADDAFDAVDRGDQTAVRTPSWPAGGRDEVPGRAPPEPRRAEVDAVAMDAQPAAPRRTLPKIDWSSAMDHVPVVGVALGPTVSGLLDAAGPIAVRFPIFLGGIGLAVAWCVTQRRGPVKTWLRSALWAGLVVAAALPAAMTLLTALSFRGAGLGYLAVGLVGVVAQLLLGARVPEVVVAAAPAPQAPAPRGRYVFEPSGEVHTIEE